MTTAIHFRHDALANPGAGRLGALSATLRGWLEDFEIWLEKREDYDRTVRELSALSDRELDDIGIARSQIREVAKGEIERPVQP